MGVQTCFAKPTNNNNADIRNKVMNCDTCKAPTFHGRDFYLPFCGGEKTFPNLCEAIALQMQKKTYPVKDLVTSVRLRNAIKSFYLSVLWMERGFLLTNVMQLALG